MSGGGKCYFSHGELNSKGVMTLFHPKFQGDVTNIKFDTDGRWLLTDIKYNEVNFSLINIYAPNKDSPKFFQEIEREIREQSNEIMVMGDYNFTFDNNMDRLNTSNNNNKAKNYVLELMEEYTLTDVWRSRHEGDKEYSWSKVDRRNG